MPVSIAILLIMVYNLSRTVEHLSQSLIYRTTDKTQNELRSFFGPVVNSLYTAKDWCQSESIQVNSLEKLNLLYIPILKNSVQISSMHLADSAENEFMVMKDDSLWQNRITYSAKTNRYLWDYARNNKGYLVKKWIQESDSSYKPSLRPWFNDVKLRNSEHFTWTKPYIFKTTKDPGITASIKVLTGNPIDPYRILAFDIKLTDISIFTTNLTISKHGKAFILNSDELFIGLPSDPRFKNNDSLKANVLTTKEELAISEVSVSINDWKNIHKLSDQPFQFESDGQKWWGGIRKYVLRDGHFFYVGVIVPEKDFLEEMQRTQYIIISGFILVLALTLMVIRGYNQKKKAFALLAIKNHEIILQKEEIQKQRDEIEEIHKDLSKSIDYAKKIQTAILPETEILKNYFSDYFVLYRPKDKVSGDFYWWVKSGNKIIITVADCTGHGVPGAFMSMLGTTYLSEIVLKDEITNPSEILSRLRNDIIQALKQKGESGEQKDGMDMSLISIDTENYILQYSGANNPIYIVHAKSTPDETAKLEELKADKMPVAIHDVMNDYTLKQAQLTKGDCIYLMSDGYQDQFGGANDKKFMTKHLKELFVTINEQGMEMQKTSLEQTLIQWIGNGKQVDDISIVGIRI